MILANVFTYNESYTIFGKNHLKRYSSLIILFF